MAFTADNYVDPGVEYDYNALNTLLAARMADGMDESNAADAINNAMVERDNGSLYVGETKVGQVQYIELENPWSGATVYRASGEFTQSKVDAIAQTLDDETLYKLEGAKSPAAWIVAFAELVGPKEAGRVIIGG